MRHMLRHPIRFMRDRRFTGSRASAYLDGELDAAGRRRVEKHARVCPQCHQLIESLRQTIAGLMGLRSEPGGEIADGVIARLHHER
jgi:anti-sigma factor RsiW